MYMIDTNMLEVVGDGGILMPILTGFSLPMIVSLGDCLYYHDRVADTLRPVAIRLDHVFCDCIFSEIYQKYYWYVIR